MGEYGYEPEPVALRRPDEQDINFWPTRFFLFVGLFPIGMLIMFWFRSGTGLHPLLVGYVLFALPSLAIAVNYYLFYSQHKPRSALVAPNVGKCLFVAALLIPAGAFNMLATPHGVALTLSPGPRIESGQMMSVMAKVVATSVSPGMLKPVKLPPRKKLDLAKNEWMRKGMFVNGALWGALGYAVPFALMGMILGFLRKEILDPRDEHIGSTAAAGLVRAMVGLYYGMGIGFALGAALIVIVRVMFWKVTAATPPAILHFIFVVGAASNPNQAFQYAFSTGCLLAGALALFAGKPDLTAPLSDPKAPELTRPIDVQIPEVPDPPQMAFDMSRVQSESQQILQQFSSQLSKVLDAPEWNHERFTDLPATGKNGQKPEPAATNIISANDPGEIDDMPTAMGSLSNVYVQIVCELGKLEIPAADWLGLAEGAILELPKSSDGTVAVTLNGKPAGRGKPLTVNGNKAVKVIGLRGKPDSIIRS